MSNAHLKILSSCLGVVILILLLLMSILTVCYMKKKNVKPIIVEKNPMYNNTEFEMAYYQESYLSENNLAYPHMN